LPVVFLQQVASFWTAALNATGRYYLPDAWSIAGSVLQIGAIVLLARPLGIYALLVALYASTLLFCFVLWSFLRREVGFRAIAAPTWTTLRAYSHLSTPFYVPAVVAQASTLVERSLCSVLGAGTASVLDYARRCVELPLGIVLSVTQTVVTPQLARHHARGEDRSASRRFGRFVIMVIAAVVPFATLLAAGAPQVVQWVLAHGAFAPDRAAATSTVLRILAIGLIGASLHSVAGQALVGRNESRRFALVSTVAQLAILGANLSLYRRLGVLAFATSWSVAHLLSGGLLLGLALAPRKA